MSDRITHYVGDDCDTRHYDTGVTVNLTEVMAQVSAAAEEAEEMCVEWRGKRETLDLWIELLDPKREAPERALLSMVSFTYGIQLIPDVKVPDGMVIERNAKGKVLGAYAHIGDDWFHLAPVLTPDPWTEYAR